MAYKALYREYRPQSFSEVVGQKAIVETLRNSIVNDRIAHAYLFCGPRGTGKTSIAKIFAKAVNCPSFEKEPCNECDNCREITSGAHPDVIEMDAASNNSVDNIRDIIEKVKYAPLRARYKVYIIDEVHMLSAGAFNALLKTLEEPPAHVIFILATTEPLKVPATIISRCQRYDFSRISDDDIYHHLKDVSKSQNLNAEDRALKMIARLSLGGMRDALSILDQCISYSGDTITNDDVTQIYGLVSSDEMVDLLIKMKEKKTTEIFEKISKYSEKGIDIKRLTSDLLNICKEAAVYSQIQEASVLNRIDESEAKHLSDYLTSSEMIQLVDLFLDTLGKYRISENASSYFDVAILKAIEILEGNRRERVVVREVSQPAEEPKPVKTVEAAKPAEAVKPAENKPQHLEGTINTVDSMKSLLTNMGVPEENLKIEEEPVQNVSRETNTRKPFDDFEVDQEMMLEILVSANKQFKAEDQEKWNKLIIYKDDLTHAKYARMLLDSKIVASAEDSMIISVPTKMLANQINSAVEDDSISDFMMELTDDNKLIIAITKDEEKELIDLFRKRSKEGTLPKPGEKVVKEKEEKKTVTDKKEETIEKKLDALFGKGNYEIK